MSWLKNAGLLFSVLGNVGQADTNRKLETLVGNQRDQISRHQDTITGLERALESERVAHQCERVAHQDSKRKAQAEVDGLRSALKAKDDILRAKDKEIVGLKAENASLIKNSQKAMQAQVPAPAPKDT